MTWAAGSGRRSSRTGTRRSCTTSGARATSSSISSASSTPGGSTATTAIPTCAPRAPARATPFGTAWIGRRPITRTRGSSCCSPRTSRRATTYPHAQRIIEAKERGARVCVIDSRLSNTASMADWWLAPWPGSESALLLAMASVLVRERLYDREFVRRWVNWEEYLRAERPDLPVSFEAFEQALRELYARYTPEFAENESGVPAATIVEVARTIGSAGSALATHVWRNAAAGHLRGWHGALAPAPIVVLN